MKQTTAANTSLVLVVLGWPFAYYGFLSNTGYGDYSPNLSHVEIVAAQHQAVAMLLIGMACLISSLWLSGYAFASAKFRSAIALAACVLPYVYLFIFGLPL
jgi:hypothetical protein